MYENMSAALQYFHNIVILIWGDGGGVVFQTGIRFIDVLGMSDFFIFQSYKKSSVLNPILNQDL